MRDFCALSNDPKRTAKRHKYDLKTSTYNKAPDSLRRLRVNSPAIRPLSDTG